MIHVRVAGAVCEESAHLRVGGRGIDRGQPVLHRELGDRPQVRLGDAVESHDHRLAALSHGRIENGGQALGAPQVEQVRLDAQRAGGLLDDGPPAWNRGIAHVEDHRHAPEPRKHLREQLDPLRVALADAAAEPGDVPTRTREARHEARLDRRAAGRHDDGNARGRVLRRERRRSSPRQDEVDFETNQLAGQGREAGVVTVRRPVDDLDIPALPTPELLQASAKGVEVGGVEGGGPGLEHADPPHLLGRLGLREGPRGKGADPAQEERPATDARTGQTVSSNTPMRRNFSWRSSISSASDLERSCQS